MSVLSEDRTRFEDFRTVAGDSEDRKFELHILERSHKSDCCGLMHIGGDVLPSPASVRRVDSVEELRKRGNCDLRIMCGGSSDS